MTTLNSMAGSSNAWTLDARGNPTTTGGATQTFNAEDQITAITGKTTPVYDNNGNMKMDESGNTYTFDAWNRMIEAQVGSTQEFYAYDADNRRPGLSICSGAVSDSYYTTGWQDIEDDVVPCVGATTKSTYVWSESYIDDLVARDQSTNGGAITRVYAEQDANHDTTSLVSSSGTVLERFVYDPYGTRTVLTPSTWAVTSDTQSWVYGFQGGRLDPLTNKINFRNRDLDTATDTWMEKDGGYWDGANLYQFTDSSPVTNVDPLGLDTLSVLQTTDWNNPTAPTDIEALYSKRRGTQSFFSLIYFEHRQWSQSRLQRAATPFAIGMTDASNWWVKVAGAESACTYRINGYIETYRHVLVSPAEAAASMPGDIAAFQKLADQHELRVIQLLQDIYSPNYTVRSQVFADIELAAEKTRRDAAWKNAITALDSKDLPGMIAILDEVRKDGE